MIVERAGFVSVPVRDVEGTSRISEATVGLGRVPGDGAWPRFELGDVSLVTGEAALQRCACRDAVVAHLRRPSSFFSIRAGPSSAVSSARSSAVDAGSIPAAST
jgi:hypothetical protein